MQEYIGTGKMNEAKKFLPKFHSQLMKVAKTGVISKKTASRKISRVTKKINNSKKKWISQLRVDKFLNVIFKDSKSK